MKNKRLVWVVGASSGIGEAIAKREAELGSILVLSARRLDRLEKLKGELQQNGAIVHVVPIDVTDFNSVALATKEIQRFSLGPIETVYANAGMGVAGRFEDLSIEDYDRQFKTNIYGVLHVAKAAQDDLKISKGKIAIVGSVAGHVSFAGTSAYGMSKFAVRSFAEALYIEWAKHGISVTHIAPGFIESEIRLKDNSGTLRSDYKDQIPSFIVMNRNTAAKKIVRAVHRRRREAIITLHGKLIYWVHRLFSEPYFFLSKTFS